MLERWITDGPFRAARAPAQSDLDVATGSDTRSILEHHWDTWVITEDWVWLAARGINTVRIPVRLDRLGLWLVVAMNGVEHLAVHRLEADFDLPRSATIMSAEPILAFSAAPTSLILKMSSRGHGSESNMRLRPRINTTSASCSVPNVLLPWLTSSETC